MASWTTYHKFLALLLIITGSLNTLSVKWADYIESKGCDGIKRTFHHPFVQSAAMFMGEMLCLLTFKVLQYSSRNTNALTQGNQHINPFILMPAAMFDLVGTSIMYIGLILTYPSSFQMLRGSIIIFVAVLSMTFLNKKIIRREWVGIVNVILGLTVVGITDALYLSPEESKGRNSLITGDLLIILAQVISACQMVYEEKFVSGLNIPPLQAVGWEGVFGFSVLSVLLVIFYWIPAPPHFAPYPGGPVEDAIDGLVQIVNSPWLFISILGNMISIAFFNFAGISVTKEMSATTRMVLDSIRTIVIWMVSISLKWQKFHWPHLIGFALLILGTCAYNGIIPNFRRRNLDSSDYPDDEILTADDSEDIVANEAEPTPDEGQDPTSGQGVPV